jgi:hypothetical protein
MIKANEIRVGNWLEWNKKPFKVCAIFRNVTENELWAKDNNELHPIPLTEEILLKCGFIKTGITELYYPTNTINISWVEEDPTVIEINCENIQCYIINCEYLHQLQNLYFALKGQELEINL